jgi:hypothetical protein
MGKERKEKAREKERKVREKHKKPRKKNKKSERITFYNLVDLQSPTYKTLI